MYQGTNPTALQSQTWIVEALTALMSEQPYSQITIKNICKRADLSRQTFYNCFDSKDEVLRFCLQKQYEPHFQRLSVQNAISLQEIIEAFASVLQDNKELLNLMIQNHLDSIITDEIAKCVALFASRFARKTESENTLPYNEALFSGALAHVLLHWFRQENPISILHLTRILSDFFSGQIFQMKI
ncbi:MAG: TetR/AcrR family transcriptional regulator [Dorea sp.]